MTTERIAILGAGAAFILIANAGHALAPVADIAWLVFGFFGIAAIPGAFVGPASERRSRR